LKTRLDKWLYFIKYLEDFQKIPEIFSDEVFSQAFEKAELAKFGQAELANYENSLKIYRDLKGIIDTAFDEGKLEGKLEIAKSLKKLGVPIETIIEASGLTLDDIEKL
jgi:predicted transposase/invertase (TIGR01784 family)